MNLEERVAKLERECRAWRRLALGFSVLVALIVSCTQDTQGPSLPTAPTASASAPQQERPKQQEHQAVQRLDKLRIRELEIVDDRGQVVGRLQGVQHGAGAMLQLFTPVEPGDRAKNSVMVSPVLGFSVTRESGGFEARANEMRFLSAETVRRQRELASKDFGKLTKEELDFMAEGPPAISIGVTTHGNGSVDINSASGKPIVAVGAGDGTSGGIVNVFNTFGKVVVSAQANKRNEGAVYVKDVDGEAGDSLTPARP